MICLIALDFILRIVFRSMMYIPLIVEVSGVNRNNGARHPSSFGVPAYMISHLEFLNHLVNSSFQKHLSPCDRFIVLLVMRAVDKGDYVHPNQSLHAFSFQAGSQPYGGVGIPTSIPDHDQITAATWDLSVMATGQACFMECSNQHRSVHRFPALCKPPTARVALSFADTRYSIALDQISV